MAFRLAITGRATERLPKEHDFSLVECARYTAGYRLDGLQRALLARADIGVAVAHVREAALMHSQHPPCTAGSVFTGEGSEARSEWGLIE
jgi:hypothetical protein